MSALLAFTIASAVAASPEAMLLQHFDTHCGTLESVEAMDQRITASGWTKFKPPENSVIGKQAKFYAESAVEAGVRIDTRAFARQQEPAYTILISEVRGADASGSIECHILNTGSSRPNKSVIENWAKRAPTTLSSDKKQMTWSWRPGLSHSATFTVITFTKSAPKNLNMFPGVGLDAVAVRFLP